MKEGETAEEYVTRLKQELEDEFQRLGPETVCAFIVEPMVGTVSPALRILHSECILIIAFLTRP
jgi:adenosylmethionine-8-amino-7-oxononanoate aminotransferase